MPKSQLTEAQVQEIYKLAIGGNQTGVEIARIFNVSPSTIYQLLKRRFGLSLGCLRPVTLCLPDDPATLSYIAAIIDGEGSIVPDKRRPSEWNVQLKMTHQGLMEELQRLGGRSVVQQPSQPRRKTVYAWNVGRARDVILLLESLLPYMKIKRGKAQTVLSQLRARVETGSGENAEPTAKEESDAF